MDMSIFITTSFPAFHHWPDAPDSCAFLREMHRHVFHVKMVWPVRTDNRDIEFITKKAEVEEWIRDIWYGKEIGTMSCERIAKLLIRKFGATIVEVSEDGENGAIVYA